MATRSAIGVAVGDEIHSIYCHWDGYLSHVGKILNTHYDRERSLALINRGDLSVLGPEIDGAPSRDACVFYSPQPPNTTFGFMTWRSDQEFVQHYRTWQCEYFYILGWDDQWWVTCDWGALKDTWTPVRQAFDLVRNKEKVVDHIEF
jgi:hypothetical protein